MIKKVLKILRGLLITLVVMYGLVVALLSFPSVQHHVGEAVAKELSRMLHTRVAIGHITVGYPNRLVLDRVAIDDLEGNELLQVARLSARFEWMPLLRHGRISIHTAQMFGLYARISRPTPDGPLNMQFLLDAFASEKDSAADAPLDLRVNSLLVRRCHLRYDVMSEAHTPDVFNPHHLAVGNINATIALKAFRRDSINAQIKRFDLTEQSGFSLKGLQMHLLANTKGIRLEDFDMTLPNSRIRSDVIRLQFPTDSLQQDFHVEGRMMGNSKLTPADMASFVPLLKHFNEPLYLSASVNGDGRTWKVPSVSLRTRDNQVALTLDEAALTLPHGEDGPWKVKASVPRLQVTQEGIPLLWHNLMGDEKPLPEVLQNLGFVHFTGQVEGASDNMATSGQLVTGIGEVVADARFSSLPDSSWMCEGHVKSDSLDMHTLLGAEQKLGIVSFNLDFLGHQSPHTQGSIYLKGTIPTLQYSGYEYQQIGLDGQFDKNSFDGLLALDDPNIALRMDGHLGLGNAIPTFDLTARITHFRPHALQLVSDREEHEYAAVLRAHFSGNDPDNLEGSLLIDSLEAALPRDTFFMPQLAIRAGHTDGDEKLMTIESEAIQARIEGAYTYRTLPASFVQIVEQYLPSLVTEKGGRRTTIHEADNEFNFNVRLADSKLYPYVLGIPLKIQPVATIKGFVSNKQKRMDISGDVPRMTYGNEVYEIGHLRCYNSPAGIVANFGIAKHMADNARVTMTMDARAAGDTLSTTLSWGNDSHITYAGSIEALTHFGKGNGQSSSDLQAEVEIKPSEIIINDTVWNVAASTIRLDSGYVDIQGLGVRHGQQHLSIHGRLTDRASDSLVVELNRIAAEYILDIVRFHSVDFSGRATGKIYVNGVLGDMQAHTDLHVDEFRFNHGLMGDMDVSARWDDELGVVLTADIREADTVALTRVNGFVSPQQDGLDLHIDTHNTNLEFLNSFIGGIFADVSGRATGPLRLHGTFDKLNLEGKAIATASLKPRILNTPFRIENDSVILTADAITFPHVTAFDPEGNTVKMSGKLPHNHLKNIRYDFRLDLDHACFYDTDDFGSMPFYGKIYGSGDVYLNGGGNVLNIDGRVTTERGTLFVYDMSAPETLTDNHFITFVDRTPRPQHIVVDNLRLFQRAQDEDEDDGDPLQVVISAYINATPNADVRVIMDKRSGDHITANGTGDIQVLYTNESVTLDGDYTIESGQYKMSIQDVIRKDFQLQQGSKVSFTGNGGEAEIDLKAVHTVNSASLSDLMPEATFNQNTVKVNCIIYMRGKLDNLVPDFDLELPTVNDEEQQMVRSAISTEEQLRTQIVYLLGVGKFYTYDYASVEGRQSSDAMTSILSSTLSGQLNNLLSQALNMDNWNFSSNFSTGQEGWSDLEVEGILSGRLLDNRLIINGNFGYRESQMRNSNFVGDFNVQFLLNRSGELSLKAYNMTNDRYFAKQTFNTQGVGFVYKREFDNWRDFFRLRK